MVDCTHCHMNRPGLQGYPHCFYCAKLLDEPMPLKEGSFIRPCPPRLAKPNLRGLCCVGPITPLSAYIKSASDADNELVALIMRQLANTPKPDEQLWADLRAWVNEGFDSLFPNYPRNLGSGDRWERFVKWAKHFPKAVREALYKAYDKNMTTYSHADIERLCRTKAFIKAEKLLKSLLGAPDPNYAPRLICSFRPEPNAIVGPIVAEWQEYFHHAWSGRNAPGCVQNILFPAGMNAEDMAERFSEAFVRFAGGRAFEDDFTLYDSTQSACSHEFGQWLLERSGAFANDPLFEKFFKALGAATIGKTRHGWRFRENATMKSGSPQTCIQNTIINVVAHLFAISRANHNMPLALVLEKVWIAAMGDDNVTLVDRDISMRGVTTTLERLGLLSKFKEVPNMSDVVFLNMWFIERAPKQYMAVPNFFRLWGKIGYAVDQPPDYAHYVYEVATAFRFSFSGLSLPREYINHLRWVAGSRFSPHNIQYRTRRDPITGEEFEERIAVNKARGLRISERVKRALNWQYQIWATKELEPTPMADSNFLRRCQLSECQAAALKSVGTSYNSIPCFITDPLLNQLCVAMAG